ncbi:hypothetical protein ACHAXT_011196 [Thalassiosira profunda]
MSIDIVHDLTRDMTSPDFASAWNAPDYQGQDQATPSCGLSPQPAPAESQDALLAAELRRLQQVAANDQSALLELLGRQQQLASATTVANPGAQFLTPAGVFGHGSQQPMGAFLSDGLNSQLASLVPPSYAGGMGAGGLDGLAPLNHTLDTSITSTTSATASANAVSSASSDFGRADELPFSSAPVGDFLATVNQGTTNTMNININNVNLASLGATGVPAANDLLQPQPSASSGTTAASSAVTAFPTLASLPSPSPAASSAPTAKEDPNWEEQFTQLQLYQLQSGHCRVPARCKANPKLGRWVMTQRRQFTLLLQGFPSALTADRIRRLEGIGFAWSVRPEPVTTWNQKYQELRAYKAAHGNCRVPQRYQPNPQLGTWVHTQRRQWKLRQEGKRSGMTNEKKAALDALGFYWAATASPQGPFDKVFEGSFEVGSPVHREGADDPHGSARAA